MFKPDISIIIPTFNRLWSLPEAIESCRHDRCRSEIIVVDDGSTDGTAGWLSQQKNIVAINQPHAGKCQAVNKGFEIAQGKYIRFLDSDDLLNKTANDEQFKLAEDSDSDVVVSGYKLFDESNLSIKTQHWVQCDDFMAQQLGECDSSHYSAYLFKKEFIKNIQHRQDFAFRDDRLFAMEVALKNPKVAIHHGIALLHRINHPDRLQITNGLKQSVQNFQHVTLYKDILSKLSASGSLTKRRIAASINVLWPLAKWIGQDHLKDSVALYKWILELDPSFKIPDRGIPGFLYRTFGFTFTQKTLRIGRFIKYGWR